MSPTNQEINEFLREATHNMVADTRGYSDKWFCSDMWCGDNCLLLFMICLRERFGLKNLHV